MSIQARVRVQALALFFLATAAPRLLPAEEGSWRIDPLHSLAQFSVRHMMISTVRGQFGAVRGTLRYDPANPSAAVVEATIDCTTINTGEPKRDNDLKGEEFFDVKKYPVMKFRSTKVEPGAPGHLKVTGDLTINATTRIVVLDVEGPTPPVKDTQNRIKIGAGATAKISRREFGILYNPVMETGGVAVSDEVAIVLDIEFIRN